MHSLSVMYSIVKAKFCFDHLAKVEPSAATGSFHP